MRIDVVSGAADVLAGVGDVLMRDEARHNLALGILSTARSSPEVYPELRAWIVRDGDEVVGAAIRTPPHNLIVAQPVRAEAVEALASTIDEELPGAVGGVPEIDGFATAWTQRQGSDASVVFEQRIYALTAVVPPAPVPGSMRLATLADRDLVLAWFHAFSEEVLHPGDNDDGARLQRSVDARLTSEDAGMALWELDGRPVSLAGFGGPTPNGIRIGPVYTPPELRGQGFGTAVTAAISRRLLEAGCRFCFLYTDLANPTSNAIYTRIGYEPVCDSREIAFVPPSPT
jgi:predicted GNAT family acetyltransferase